MDAGKGKGDARTENSLPFRPARAFCFRFLFLKERSDQKKCEIHTDGQIHVEDHLNVARQEREVEAKHQEEREGNAEPLPELLDQEKYKGEEGNDRDLCVVPNHHPNDDVHRKRGRERRNKRGELVLDLRIRENIHPGCENEVEEEHPSGGWIEDEKAKQVAQFAEQKSCDVKEALARHAQASICRHPAEDVRIPERKDGLRRCVREEGIKAVRRDVVDVEKCFAAEDDRVKKEDGAKEEQRDRRRVLILRGNQY